MFEQNKIAIDNVLTDLGFKRNPQNKKLADDYHGKYYSYNQLEIITNNTTFMKNYLIDINIGINIKNNEEADEAFILFDELARRISKLDYFLGYRENPLLKQRDKNPNKLIGKLYFIIDNSYC